MKESHLTKEALIKKYKQIRSQTVDLCNPLINEDYVIQSMEDVSPPKWHLAHTTWFFETFILIPNLKKYSIFNKQFHYLFNSYYYGLGNPYPRSKRGLLARPTVATVYQYRDYVDQHLLTYLETLKENELNAIKSLLELGLHHEQQHQELLLMDIKHNFSIDLDFPIYFKAKPAVKTKAKPLTFREINGGIVEIGYQGKEFCFDNELPPHQCILKPYAMANRLVTNGEYIEFIAAGGYQTPALWLADGWDFAVKNKWQAPLYWHYRDQKWFLFSLNGLTEVNMDEPVAHISFYEADAYARWRNCRLATENEWEHYAQHNASLEEANFLEKNHFHPQASDKEHLQLFGDVWEWTASSYHPYPGFKPLEGNLAEYNGKFMSNQMVLRGGSCITPSSHMRFSYRNFFQPDKRWQFSGVRLAKDL